MRTKAEKELFKTLTILVVGFGAMIPTLIFFSPEVWENDSIRVGLAIIGIIFAMSAILSYQIQEGFDQLSIKGRELR